LERGKTKGDNKSNKGCVTLWPCHIYIKKYILKAKRRRIMEKTQIFHHAKNILIFKKTFL
jgi:hypothetical protein